MKIFNEIITELERKLELLEAETEDVILKAEKGIKITRLALETSRERLCKRNFRKNSEEIHFFKNIKPHIFSKLIYYVKLFNIETKRPRGSKKSQIKYLNNHIDKLQIYFNDNLEFYHYFRRGATFLDEQYFLRGKADIRLHPETFHFFTDKEFSTSHDSTVATILAYDMLIVHLKKEVDKLDNNGMDTSNEIKEHSSLYWTGNKTDLIELIYALHSCRVINSGTADIKEIATLCERLLNIDLGNYYHTFIEIRARKTNQTKFIDFMRDCLLVRIQAIDE